MVVVSGLDWETDLTPWKAPGLKAGEFAGKAQAFLDILAGDLMVNVESYPQDMVNNIQKKPKLK